MPGWALPNRLHSACGHGYFHGQPRCSCCLLLFAGETGFEPARTHKGFNIATLNPLPPGTTRRVCQFRHSPQRLLPNQVSALLHSIRGAVTAYIHRLQGTGFLCGAFRVSPAACIPAIQFRSLVHLKKPGTFFSA